MEGISSTIYKNRHKPRYFGDISKNSRARVRGNKDPKWELVARNRIPVRDFVTLCPNPDPTVKCLGNIRSKLTFSAKISFLFFLSF